MCEFAVANLAFLNLMNDTTGTFRLVAKTRFVLQNTMELCGRCIATPLVKISTETYSSPDFPPKLSWYKFHSQRDNSGAVLAAFELIEVRYFSNLSPISLVLASYHIHIY